MCLGSRGICSLTLLLKRRARRVYENDKRNLSCISGDKLAKVHSEGDVLVVLGDLSGALVNAILVCSVVESQEHVSEAIHFDTLYNWPMRYGYQSYDASETLTAKPGSGIKLTVCARPNCMTCAEDKQTKKSNRSKIAAKTHVLTGSVE
jgi:hypothetical protein